MMVLHVQGKIAFLDIADVVENLWEIFPWFLKKMILLKITALPNDM